MTIEETTIARLSLLGTFALEINGKPIRLPTRKAEGLLAYLVLHRGVQNRERVAALFWGDATDELARRSLRTALSALRKELGDDFVVADRETIQLNPEFSMWVDVYEMEKQAKDILAGNQQAVINPDLYGGDLLIDFYDEWILEEREHYRSLFINALHQIAQSLKTNGNYKQAIVMALKIIAIDSVNEQAYQHLMLCHNALGNRTEALQAFDECKNHLMEQLGVEPSKDTLALYEQITKANTDSPASFAKSNLPNPLTSFIGREHEIDKLKEIFNTTRLLTLTGVGGCGKTRLSIQFATQIVDHFADGTWWIELASIQDESSLVPVVLKSLGIAESQIDSLEESLSKFLRSRKALLVMDNCEHVITACAHLAETILSQCPDVKILATSREALSIHGEIAWLVPSLSLPPMDHTIDLMKFECPRLFLERATNYRPDLQLNISNTESLLRICRALEGIPLAIELAAARVKTLSLEQLASRLDDKLNLLTTGSRAAQPRQQTLRAAIDWSYELLSIQEQVVLQRLSIFYGPWTLEAAEFVCSDNQINLSEILDLLTHLLDKSLLVSENPTGEIRYRMLEIVRQYAFEKLEATGNTELIRDRHVQYYSELAQKARPAWFTKKQATLIKRFDADYPNVRAALAWGLEGPKREGNWDYGLRLAISLAPFWNFLAENNEGKLWLKKVVDEITVHLAESNISFEERTELFSWKAKALYEYGFLIWFQSFYNQARAIFLECAEIFTELKDETGLAHAYIFLAHSTWGLGEREAARAMWAQALEQFDKTGDVWGAGMVHSFLGRAEREAENYDRAEYHYDRCVQLFEAAGDDWGLSIGVSHQGMLAFQRNDPARALSLFERRLALSQSIGFKQSMAYAIFLMGMAAWKLGDTAQVKKNMVEAMAYFYQIGNYITLSESLLGLAWVAAQEGKFERSAWLLGAVMKADEFDRVRMGFEENYFHQPLMKELQTSLQDKKFHDVIERGQNATIDQVVAEVDRW